jgi:hypothetical protein
MPGSGQPNPTRHHRRHGTWRPRATPAAMRAAAGDERGTGREVRARQLSSAETYRSPGRGSRGWPRPRPRRRGPGATVMSEGGARPIARPCTPRSARSLAVALAAAAAVAEKGARQRTRSSPRAPQGQRRHPPARQGPRHAAISSTATTSITDAHRDARAARAPSWPREGAVGACVHTSARARLADPRITAAGSAFAGRPLTAGRQTQGPARAGSPLPRVPVHGRGRRLGGW